MLYLTCTSITSVDLAHYRVYRAKDWVSVDGGTNYIYCTCHRLLRLMRICFAAQSNVGVVDGAD